MIVWRQKISKPKHSFVIFSAKILYEKHACKIMVKLTADLLRYFDGQPSQRSRTCQSMDSDRKSSQTRFTERRRRW